MRRRCCKFHFAPKSQVSFCSGRKVIFAPNEIHARERAASFIMRRRCCKFHFAPNAILRKYCYFLHICGARTQRRARAAETYLRRVQLTWRAQAKHIYGARSQVFARAAKAYLRRVQPTSRACSQSIFAARAANFARVRKICSRYRRF